ncbi:hypothetical protein [Agarivorans sp. Alg241-V36]|uniref:hypothetical protein n=1 Tax=Agarivorans sp. Alg241-V36 TaxID=2305992 RepID=UPI0013D79E79|nr:hypothetical protein [Agarivorans sp. Alg241-V36]
MSTPSKPTRSAIPTNLKPFELNKLLNTPWKKLALVGLVCSQLLIFGFLAIAGVIGALIHLSVEQIASLGAGLWVLGEVLFFASIAILGKPVFNILKAQAMAWLKRSNIKK